ncbi:MAG: stage III sporulation protein AA, partial [Christensenellales bacterium]
TIKYNLLFEIRLRVLKPICINYGNKFYFLSPEGLCGDEDNAIICTKNLIDSIILKSSNYSLYSVNEDIKRGFITLNSGIRIGICGEVVEEAGCVKTIKNFNSLNIRFPHEVRNCSLNVLNHIIDSGQIFNTLVLSSPGAGKTTFIRDLCYQIGKRNYPLNLLLLDERNEISGINKGEASMDVGKFTDICQFSSKKMGFENGIRTMNPNVIITDEICNKEDVESLVYACNSGVNIIATTHAKDINDLKDKKLFNEILAKHVFKRFVVLSAKNGAGTIEGVFDENLIRIV